jgi:hypothetical protein
MCVYAFAERVPLLLVRILLPTTPEETAANTDPLDAYPEAPVLERVTYINGAVDPTTGLGSITIGSRSTDVGIGQSLISGYEGYFGV